MHLFINSYTDKDAERNNELIQCFKRNYSNLNVDLITRLIDVQYTEAKEFEGVSIELCFGRPTIKDFINVINANSVYGDIAIIANSDIYFDETLSLANEIKEGECYALSRYDDNIKGLIPFHRRDSQDAWIFRTPIRMPNHADDLRLGVPGIDNRLAFELNNVGYKVTNPCSQIKAIHLHRSNRRNYTSKDRIEPPYLLVNPT